MAVMSALVMDRRAVLSVISALAADSGSPASGLKKTRADDQFSRGVSGAMGDPGVPKGGDAAGVLRVSVSIEGVSASIIGESGGVN